MGGAGVGWRRPVLSHCALAAGFRCGLFLFRLRLAPSFSVTTWPRLPHFRVARPSESEIEIEGDRAHVSGIDDPYGNPAMTRVLGSCSLDHDGHAYQFVAYMMSIIDLHPLRHTMSTVTTIAHIAPMMRKMPARTVRAVGT